MASFDHLQHQIDAIKESGLTIYDLAPRESGKLWIPTPDLEQLLDTSMRGVDLIGLPLRTRSRIVKEHVCRALGYPVPRTFRRTQPRFPGQHFDVYVQKSDNLQIWNEELEPARRYVVVRVGEDETIVQVKVAIGEDLARLDTTGTLTRKYQARMTTGRTPTHLVSETDTAPLRDLVDGDADLSMASPISPPDAGLLLPIRRVFDDLRNLTGTRFPDPGPSQERNRGAVLHGIVCRHLGYQTYSDDGRFPDIRHQLLEVKLQTSETIDLGLVDPHSEEPLDMPLLNGVQVRHCDVRYAIFGAATDGQEVVLTEVVVTTGEMFFARFAQFGGLVLNKKLQIRLPHGFYDKIR